MSAQAISIFQAILITRGKISRVKRDMPPIRYRIIITVLFIAVMCYLEPFMASTTDWIRNPKMVFQGREVALPFRWSSSPEGYNAVILKPAATIGRDYGARLRVIDLAKGNPSAQTPEALFKLYDIQPNSPQASAYSATLANAGVSCGPTVTSKRSDDIAIGCVARDFSLAFEYEGPKTEIEKATEIVSRILHR